MKDFRQGRVLIHLAAAGCLVLSAGCDLVSDPPSGPVATSLIEDVYVIDSEGTTCLSCADGVMPVEVRELLDAVDPSAAGKWIQSHFTMRYENFNPRMKSADPTRFFVAFTMDESHGVFFQGGEYQIHYESIPCWVWDCYKPRLWRIDDSGKQRWRRRVPFAHAPVIPFVVDKYVLYIGGSLDGYMLVIVDVDTGEIVGHFLPEGEKEGFSDSGLLFDPPFYRDGLIYLRGHTETRWEPGTFKNKTTTPAKIYVLKVSF